MITREAIEDFFSSTRALRQRGDAQFNVDDTCLWSFFFVDPSQAKLKPVAEHLNASGYKIWGYLDPDADNEEPVYYLRADRLEKHTVSSLLNRNTELYAVASRFGVQDYDGMDVGAVDGP